MPDDLHRLPPHRTWSRAGTRPVLALHCSLAHSGAWSGLAERLTGITMTATDQPGHGRAADWDGVSDLHKITTDGSIAMAEDLGDGGPIDLIGHSFGGTVALRMALERPDLVRSLTLIEPVIFAAAKGTTEFQRFLKSHLALADLISAEEFDAAARMFHGHWGEGRFDDLPERTRHYFTHRIPLIAAQNPYLLDDSSGLLRAGGLENVGVPALLIEGADSPDIIAAVHRALSKRLPKAQRFSVVGAGHMVPITHPDLIAKAVQTHLNSTS